MGGIGTLACVAMIQNETGRNLSFQHYLEYTAFKVTWKCEELAVSSVARCS